MDLRTEALNAYSALAADALLPKEVPQDPVRLAQALKALPEARAAEAAKIEQYLADAGFAAFESGVLANAAKGVTLSSARKTLLAKKMGGKEAGRAGALGVDPSAIAAQLDHGPKKLTELASFAKVALAFSGPMGAKADFPPEIAALTKKLQAWNDASLATWTGFDDKLVHTKTAGLGTAIADAIRLQREIRTKRIDDWLASAPEAAKNAFESWRGAFFARADALGCLAAEGLIASDLLLPEHGALKAMLHNTKQLGDLVGGKDYMFSTVGMYVGLARVVVKERKFFAGIVGKQLRMKGLSFSHLIQAKKAEQLNTKAGHFLISPKHSEELRAAYVAMKERGVTGERADELALLALEAGHAASGKSWKGLIRLTDLMVFSGADPKQPGFAQLFAKQMGCPVDYTHVPGKEWIVRDYELGKKLMQIDGKVTPGESAAGLQQGRGSLAAGYIRAGAARTEFGRKYSKPLGAFLDSMVVAEGADHQRQRKPFLPFFSQKAVIEQAKFVEETTQELLDSVALKARQNGGAFDFRQDFAYHFPIQVICKVLELPPSDVKRVQKWAETSVRAMDTDAGVTVDIANAGQRASDEFRVYLQGKLNDARAGKFEGAMIKAVANDPTLSEAERIANLGVIIFAGFETTTGLLSKGLYALLERPQQWAYLKTTLVEDPPVDGVPDRELRWLVWSEKRPEREVDPARLADLKKRVAASPALAARLEATKKQEAALDAAVEEMLRWTAPGTVVPLTASKDVAVELPAAMEIQGRAYAAGETLTIKRGETIGVAVDELNRRCPFGGGKFDPSAKGSFDVSRADNAAHLSFGVKHQCIGAFLAKENAKRALEGVLRRFPDLALNGNPIPQDMELFSGLASLPVVAPSSNGT